MKVNGMFIFFATAVVIFSIYSQPSDAYRSKRSNPAVIKNQGCTSNENCDWRQKCENNTCIDACDSFNCGPKQRCWAQEHTPTCYCRIGHDVPLDLCEKYCRRDYDCNATETCRQNKCTMDWNFRK